MKKIYLLILFFCSAGSVMAGEISILSHMNMGDKNVYDLVVQGNYTYVISEGTDLQIFDTSDPENPILKSTLDTFKGAYSIAVSENYVYVPDGRNGFYIYDVSDPENPALKSTFEILDYIYDVIVSGNYAYVIGGNDGLFIIDISDPVNPALKSTFEISDYIYDVTVSGNYAYVIDNTIGLCIIDVTDPANPALKSTFEISDYVYDVTVSGNYAYVAADNDGLFIINISDPENPSLESTFDTSGYVYGVALNGNYAYVADGNNGLVVIDISDPTTPTLFAQFTDENFDFLEIVRVDEDGRAYLGDLYDFYILSVTGLDQNRNGIPDENENSRSPGSGGGGGCQLSAQAPHTGTFFQIFLLMFSFFLMVRVRFNNDARKTFMKTKLLIVMVGFLSISCGGSGTPQKSISPTLALSQGIAALESQDVFTAESEFCDAAEFSPDDSSLAFGCFWSKMMLSPESDNVSLALASLGEPAFDLETQIFGDTGIFALSSNIISTQFPLFNYTDFNLPFASYLKNKETEWPLEVVGLLQKAIDLGLGTSDIQERVANLTGTFVEFETYLTTVLNDPNFSFTLPGELFDIDHDIVVTPNDIKLMLGSVKLTIATLQIFSAYDLGVEIENFVHDGFYNLNQLVSDLNGDGTTVNGITLDTTAFLTLIDKETVANTESRIISGLEYILDGLNTVNEGESSDLSKPAVDERNLNPTLMMINDLLASYTNNTLTDVRFPGLSKTIKINLKAFFDNPPDAKTLDASSGYPFVVEDYKVKHVETYFIDLLNGTADF